MWESSIKLSRENRKTPTPLPAEIVFASAHQSIIRERNRKKVKTYTEDMGELNSVPFSAADYRCDTRSVPQISISQAVSCNRSPLLDTLRSNTESPAPSPSVTGASVSVVNTGCSYLLLPGPLTDQLHGVHLSILSFQKSMDFSTVSAGTSSWPGLAPVLRNCQENLYEPKLCQELL